MAGLEAELKVYNFLIISFSLFSYNNSFIRQNALGRISVTTDMWSDPNLSPFMAVTAHWIETEIVQTARGPQYRLKLRAELIGFHRVPGSHTGEHLAQALLYILDRLGIASKVSHNDS